VRILSRRRTYFGEIIDGGSKKAEQFTDERAGKDMKVEKRRVEGGR